MALLTTFPRSSEFEKALALLERLGLPYGVIRPDPGYSLVGEPALIMSTETRMALARSGAEDCVYSGWVEHRPAPMAVPDRTPSAFDEDILGRASIMVLASCTADVHRIRIIAHISGDLSPAFPYWNARMQGACYNPNGPTFTFMDGHRMVSAYPRRIAVAKADGIVDAWRMLEEVRTGINAAWEGRAEIEPSYEMRTRPPAIEIFKRLPQTNCGLCGERSCLAFAVRVHGGELPASLCEPVFRGELGHLQDALVQVCAGLGVGRS